MCFFPPSSRHDWNQSRAACLFHGDKNVSLMTLTFSCFQMVERQLAQLLLVKPNYLGNFDGRNFTFQIKILHLKRQYCSSLCPIAQSRVLLASARPAALHKCSFTQHYLSFCINVKVVRLINESYPTAFQKIQICLANEKLHQHQRSPLKRASLIELIFDHAQTLHKHSGNGCLIIS